MKAVPSITYLTSEVSQEKKWKAQYKKPKWFLKRKTFCTVTLKVTKCTCPNWRHTDCCSLNYDKYANQTLYNTHTYAHNSLHGEDPVTQLWQKAVVKHNWPMVLLLWCFSCLYWLYSTAFGSDTAALVQFSVCDDAFINDQTGWLNPATIWMKLLLIFTF